MTNRQAFKILRNLGTDYRRSTLMKAALRFVRITRNWRKAAREW